MISIPGVLILGRYGMHNAKRTFIVVFPDGLESLQFFWVTQMYEKYC